MFESEAAFCDVDDDKHNPAVNINFRPKLQP